MSVIPQRLSEPSFRSVGIPEIHLMARRQHRHLVKQCPNGGTGLVDRADDHHATLHERLRGK